MISNRALEDCALKESSLLSLKNSADTTLSHSITTNKKLYQKTHSSTYLNNFHILHIHDNKQEFSFKNTNLIFDQKESILNYDNGTYLFKEEYLYEAKLNYFDKEVDINFNHKKITELKTKNFQITKTTKEKIILFNKENQESIIKYSQEKETLYPQGKFVHYAYQILKNGSIAFQCIDLGIEGSKFLYNPTLENIPIKSGMQFYGIITDNTYISASIAGLDTISYVYNTEYKNAAISLITFSTITAIGYIASSNPYILVTYQAILFSYTGYRAVNNFHEYYFETNLNTESPPNIAKYSDNTIIVPDYYEISNSFNEEQDYTFNHNYILFGFSLYEQ